MTTMSSNKSTISPEILFLIKQQAKAIAQINALQKKVDQLEHTIKSQNKSNDNSILLQNCASSSSTKNLVNNNSNNSKERIAISDDSGGEYSRATTTSEDDDELSLLLDQIARHSQQLTVNSVKPSAPPLRSSPSQSSSMSQISQNQSISALLFEPNVENVLKNLDDIIATEAIDSNKFSTASTLSQTYQRSQTSQHSSHSLYDNIGLIGVNPIGVSSGSLLQSNSNTSSNWQLERANRLVKKREEREVIKQMKLNEEWLQNQLKANPKDFRFKRNNK